MRRLEADQFGPSIVNIADYRRDKSWKYIPNRYEVGGVLAGIFIIVGTLSYNHPDVYPKVYQARDRVVGLPSKLEKNFNQINTRLRDNLLTRAIETFRV